MGKMIKKLLRFQLKNKLDYSKTINAYLDIAWDKKKIKKYFLCQKAKRKDNV